MKFLAIDTSASRLTVVAVNGETAVKYTGDECAQRHSVELMPQIENALERAHMRADECDFFACVVGPGSFTGIRIGIATVKGLCLALGKPALAITSFETLAYAETGKRLALVGAGHGNYYACAYGEHGEEIAPAFLSGEQTQVLVNEGYTPLCADGTYPTAHTADVAEGLLRAATAKSKTGFSGALEALYLRKSSAEEKR
ncbi:MAG: tRNA (adenosine(37)-N6)-threonylcarbamoyltransferase complex dimerization subunit type 1 TsaB [Clostridia bacterium]|nr:tRNA (adenosine(37)-N6)-threonylcarbamoyltransferase complex dimerization subunit type 1 TsaB [Clostridia bacterium]